MQPVAPTRCRKKGTDKQWQQEIKRRDEVRTRAMANSKQSTAKRMRMSERAQQQMEVHFPNVPPQWIWRRKTNDGFTTLPRTLPIIMQAVDAQTKGQPAGHTLFCLWARSPDHPLITIENPNTFASEAGFAGERAVDTWRKRMKSLRDLWLIQTKPGATGEFHYVLLINPNAAVEWMRNQRLIQDGLYARFIDRLIEVGGYGEIEAVRALWKTMNDAAAAAATAQAAVSPPPTDAIATVAPNPTAKGTSKKTQRRKSMSAVNP